MVSVWLAGFNPVAETVMVGLPAVVSRKKKLPVPLLIPTEVTVPLKGPVLSVSNRIVGESEEVVEARLPGVSPG
jgi:hypothetical protein